MFDANKYSREMRKDVYIIFPKPYDIFPFKVFLLRTARTLIF